MPNKDMTALQQQKGELKTKLAGLKKEKAAKRKDFLETKKQLRRVARKLKVRTLAAAKHAPKAAAAAPATPAAEQPAGQTPPTA
jgi:hypothetical protein